MPKSSADYKREAIARNRAKLEEDLNGLIRSGFIDEWTPELHGPKLTVYRVSLPNGQRWTFRPAEIVAVLAVLGGGR